MSDRRQKSGMGYTHIVGLDAAACRKYSRGAALVEPLRQYLTLNGVSVYGCRQHRLWRDPSVPAPRGNRAISLAIRWNSPADQAWDEVETAVAAAPELQLEALCLHFLQAECEFTSDAGLCLADPRQLNGLSQELQAYAQRCRGQFVHKQESLELCRRANILVEELSGSGQGIVGALAAIVFHHFGRGDSRELYLHARRADPPSEPSPYPV